MPATRASHAVPDAVARAVAVMSSYGGEWFLCGGWAVDAWLGRQTREHKDVDIAVFQDGLPGLSSALAGWELIAHDTLEPDAMEPWHGRPLSLPAHIHARGDGAELDVQVNERDGPDWLLSREPRVALSLSRSASPAAWGLRAAVPEVLLFFKACEARTEDEADLRTLLPHLSAGQVAWLRDAIALVQPGHAWLGQLPV